MNSLPRSPLRKSKFSFFDDSNNSSKMLSLSSASKLNKSNVSSINNDTLKKKSNNIQPIPTQSLNQSRLRNRTRISNSTKKNKLYPTIYDKSIPSTTTSSSNTLHHKTVTIFGFPADKTDLVIARFQSYGEIIRRKDGIGNWIHLTYKDINGYQNALLRNGERIGDIMVGVKEMQQDLLYNDDINNIGSRDLSLYNENHQNSFINTNTQIYDDEHVMPGRIRKSFCQTLIDSILNW